MKVKTAQEPKEIKKSKERKERYVSDTIARISKHVHFSAMFKGQVYFYDNIYHHASLQAIYDANFTYLTEDAMTVIILQGQATFMANGEKYNLGRQSVIYLPPETALRIYDVQPGTKFAVVRTTPELTEQSFLDLGLYLDRISRKDVKAQQFKKEDFQEALKMYDEYIKGLSHKELRYLSLYVRAYNNLFLSFLLNVLQVDTKIKGKATSRQENIYRNFIDLLNQYASSEREVQFYAEKLNITPKYLSNITQTYSGKNASTWITEYVVDLAIGLMREKKCKIEEISTMLNFPSQSFFGRFFKRATGMSPKRYSMTQL